MDDREGKAAIGAATIGQHGAGAALAVVASLLVGASQCKILAKKIEQRHARINRQCVRLAVHSQFQRSCGVEACRSVAIVPPRWKAAPKHTPPVKTPTVVTNSRRVIS